MIVRTWTGWTDPSRAGDYEDYMHRTALPGYATVPGNLGVLMTRRQLEERTEFLMVSLWESMRSVTAFAGPEPSRAVFYPRDDELLLDRELDVRHYEVYGSTLDL